MFSKNHARFMQQFKRLIFLWLSSLLLTGCTDMFKTMGYIPAPSRAAQACEVSPILITDLTQKPQDRLYQLKDGQTCSEITPHEKTSTFESENESENFPNFH